MWFLPLLTASVLFSPGIPCIAATVVVDEAKLLADDSVQRFPGVGPPWDPRQTRTRMPFCPILPAPWGCRSDRSTHTSGARVACVQSRSNRYLGDILETSSKALGSSL